MRTARGDALSVAVTTSVHELKTDISRGPSCVILYAKPSSHVKKAGAFVLGSSRTFTCRKCSKVVAGVVELVGRAPKGFFFLPYLADRYPIRYDLIGLVVSDCCSLRKLYAAYT